MTSDRHHARNAAAEPVRSDGGNEIEPEVRMTLRLSARLDRAVGRMARSAGVSKTDVIRLAVDQYVASEEVVHDRQA